jgi:hypothetical protein
MLFYGVALLVIELVLDPSARWPSLFDVSPLISVVWFAILFAVLVALSWRWLMTWCFGWRPLEEGDKRLANERLE